MVNAPPKVLTFVRGYLPGFKYGGPIRSLASMAERLAGEISFRVVTSDHDFGDAEPYPGIPPGVWQRAGNATVMYLPVSKMTLSGVRAIIQKTEHDIVYLNSFFAPAFTIRPLLLRRLGLIPRRPVIVAPRGEFSPGALALKSYKKRPYLTVVRPAGLYAGVTWHASTAVEAANIRRWFGAGAAVVVAPNLAAAMTAAARPRAKPSAELRLVFISRINREKNLHGAVTMLRGLRGNVTFDIYGPLGDPAYFAHCQRLAAALPANVRVGYRGMVPHEQVPTVLAQYNVLFLPSRGENFGHAILEALAAGRPVIISDRTPWRGLAEHRAGWDLPLEQPAQFTRVLQRCVDMGPEEYAIWSEGARAHAQTRQSDPTLVDRTRNLFHTVLSYAPPPADAAEPSLQRSRG